MKRPRPIRVLIAFLTFINGLALAVIPVLLSFGMIDWTPEQVGLVEVLIGVVVVGLGGIIAAWQGEPQNPLARVQRGLRIEPTEAMVTPTSDPRDDGLAPLVPIANDYLDD